MKTRPQTRSRQPAVAILYEDSQVLCAQKPCGLLSQSDGTGAPDMLTVLKKYIKEKYSKPGDVYLGLVHRLDRPVGGVMAFARTSKAAARLSEQIRLRSVRKTYLAVLHGVPGEAAGRLENYISKNPGANLVKVTDLPGTDGAADFAALEYRTLASADVVGGGVDSIVGGSNYGGIASSGVCNASSGGGVDSIVGGSNYSGIASGGGGASGCRKFSLVSVSLLTGRPHQIRAQFAHIGHPVVGDRKYGFGRPEDMAAEWPALWAYSLEFAHPVKDAPLAVSAPPPAGFPWGVFGGIDGYL